MLTVLFAAVVHAAPFLGEEPDLSFKETTLITPRCKPGTTHTWDIAKTVEGRAHGRHVNTGEEVDKPISRQWTRTITMTCIENAPLRVALKMGFGGEMADFTLQLKVTDWSHFEVTEVSADTAAGRKAAETWKLGANLREPLTWIFPPMAKDNPNAGDAWDGAWPLELGPWWDCHGAVTAGAVQSGLRSYDLKGRCEQISYHGRNHVSGTFTREDGGFGVAKASWKVSSSWEHYYIYNDTEHAVTVTRR